MANFNKVILIGNLTRDPELRFTKGGTPVCEFGMAMNRKYRDKEGKSAESACFVDVVAWSRQAELIAEYLTKGRAIFVEGRLEYDQWTTQDGQKRSKLRVVVENFQFLGQGRSGEGSRGRGGAGDQSAPSDVDEKPFSKEPYDDDIPF